jgi:hypothetical protein
MRTARLSRKEDIENIIQDPALRINVANWPAIAPRDFPGEGAAAAPNEAFLISVPALSYGFIGLYHSKSA